jgi:predicted dehydrogenase
MGEMRPAWTDGLGATSVDPFVQCWKANAATAIKLAPDRPRVGVVGSGYWGAKHVRVLSHMREVSSVAVIETDERSRARAVAAFPGAHGFASLDSALSHVDALVIATPARTHFDLALKGLNTGKHVLVEKPLATSVREARVLVETARRTGMVLMAGHTFAFNPAVQELKRRIDSRELGKLYYLDSSRLNLGTHRSDVNVVWDLAVHDIYIMNYLLNSVPDQVSAWGSASLDSGLEDLAYVRLTYREQGVNAYVRVSWLGPRKVRRVTVVGDKKMAVYDDLGEERLRIFDRGVDLGAVMDPTTDRPVSYRYGDTVSPHICSEEPLATEVQHFINSIRDGTAPRTDGISGLAAVTVLEAIDASLATQVPQEVRWPGGLGLPYLADGKRPVSGSRQ